MTKEETIPSPPKDLSRESAAWWASVVATFELETHHIKLLTLAARAWDRAESARRALLKGGLTYRDAHKVQRPRPEILIERNSMTVFARLVRELRLDFVEDDEPRIPRNSLGWKQRNAPWLRRENHAAKEETPTPPRGGRI